MAFNQKVWDAVSFKKLGIVHRMTLGKGHFVPTFSGGGSRIAKGWEPGRTPSAARCDVKAAARGAQLGAFGSGRFQAQLILHQDLDRLFELEVFPFSDAFGVVPHFDVRFDLGLFHELTFFIPETNFRNTED